MDYHTIKSELLGYNSYGFPEFDTTYTELGTLLKKAKYRQNRPALDVLAEAASSFIADRSWTIDCLVPIPPSNTNRKYQPVFEITKRISVILKTPVCWDCVTKIMATPQLKNMHDYAARLKIIREAFSVDKKKTSGRAILLFDDLYRSGATMNAVAKALREQGFAKAVYVLAITKTRSTL